MSAFYRFIFSTFLLLALGCFWASAAFATVYTYYRDAAGLQCATSSGSFCSDVFSKILRKTNYQYSYEGCDLFGYSSVQVKYYETPPSYNSTGIYYEAARRSTIYTTAAAVLTKDCPVGTTFKLTGCTATCESDPCNSKIGRAHV